jgi:hypothetical protein
MCVLFIFLLLLYFTLRRALVHRAYSSRGNLILGFFASQLTNNHTDQRSASYGLVYRFCFVKILIFLLWLTRVEKKNWLISRWHAIWAKEPASNRQNNEKFNYNWTWCTVHSPGCWLYGFNIGERSVPAGMLESIIRPEAVLMSSTWPARSGHNLSVIAINFTQTKFALLMIMMIATNWIIAK